MALKLIVSKKNQFILDMLKFSVEPQILLFGS